ncbi:hypothetical protein SLA2020_197750 [Shorea laevis]
MRSLWRRRILLPVPSGARLSEIFRNELLCSIRILSPEIFRNELLCSVWILSPDHVVQTLAVGKIFLETISSDHIQAPASWEIDMLAYLRRIEFRFTIRLIN